MAVGSALFILLYTTGLSALQLLGLPAAVSGAPLALSRTASTAAFLAVQEAAGLPRSRWLARSGDGGWLLWAPPLLFAAAYGALAVVAPAAAGTLLPAPQLPSLGRALDVVLAAPVTEDGSRDTFIENFIPTYALHYNRISFKSD